MKKLLILFVTLFSALFIISACSSSDRESSDSAQPKDLVAGFAAEPITLDPHDANDSVSNQANLLLYDKLITFDEDNNLVPELATDWTFSEDGMALTLTLREDVTFHDGTPFNAEAVKANFERIIDEDNNLARMSIYADYMENIEVDNEYQVTINFHKPFGAALATLAHGAGGIVSPKAIEEGQDIGTNPAGTGPYKLVEWTPGTEMNLEPNENYWGDDPQLDSISLRVIPEDSSRSIALENGEIDVASPLSIQDIERLQENEDIEVTHNPIYRNLQLILNFDNPLFQDKKVRQALNYAVDKETIIQSILKDMGEIATAPIGSSLNGYSEIGTYEYDPEKAKELLEEAGVEPGTKIKLWTSEAAYIMDSTIAQFIQQNLTEVGFDVEFQVFEYSSYLDVLEDPDPDFDIIVGSWGASTGDVDWGLRPTLTSEGSNNYGGYSNDEVDELVLAGLNSSDMDERVDIYHEAMQIIHEDAPWVFLLEYSNPIAVRSEVKNVYNWGNGYVVLRNAFIE